MKYFQIVLSIIILALVACNIDHKDDSGVGDKWGSWSRVELINSIERLNNNTVSINCVISLPTPCCGFSSTEIVDTDSSKMITLHSSCTTDPCITVIAIDTVSIELDWDTGNTNRLQFQTNSDVYLDTTITL